MVILSLSFQDVTAGAKKIFLQTFFYKEYAKPDMIEITENY